MEDQDKTAEETTGGVAAAADNQEAESGASAQGDGDQGEKPESEPARE